MKGNLLSPIGWKNTKKKRRGFTLVEVILSMFIQLILISLSFKIAMSTYKNYITLINASKNQDSFDDSLLNIDRLLKTQMIESIEVKEKGLGNNEEITITYRMAHFKEEEKKKRIFLDNRNKKIVLETYKLGELKGTNILMRNVSEFNVIRKNKISYLRIKDTYGEERIICL